jgi:hypothetical protein
MLRTVAKGTFSRERILVVGDILIDLHTVTKPLTQRIAIKDTDKQIVLASHEAVSSRFGSPRFDTLPSLP